MGFKELRDKVFKSFNFNTSFSLKYSSDGLKVYEGGKNTYVLDSDEAREIACYPFVVGERFESLNLSAAKKFVSFLDREGKLSDKIIMQHVLRASLGYKVHEALREKGVNFVESWYRPLYRYVSFRMHTVRELVMTYEEPKQLPQGEYVVFKPDTEATGNTSLFVLENLLKKCSNSGCKIKKVLFYGFISEESVKKLTSFLESYNISSEFYALENVTPLASNGYDMPLYGLDEPLYRSEGKKVKLAASAPEEVVERMLPCYFPGMDQPGDWSERQVKLFDGYSWKEVDLKVHAKRSLEVLNSLREISKSEDWYDEAHEEIYNKISSELTKILSL